MKNKITNSAPAFKTEEIRELLDAEVAIVSGGTVGETEESGAGDCPTDGSPCDDIW